MSIEPLIVEFEVAVTPAHAFETWTRRCAMWWPPSHTPSGDPSAITFEPHTGGRIFERAQGSERDWGEILDWEPPGRLRYLWHLFFDRSEATEVEVTFTATTTGTAVRLAQSGWERLGVAGAERRERTGTAWGMLAEHFIQACQVPVEQAAQPDTEEKP
jgi:uncharacterized protein YndB with AHSA1/START domain